MSFVNPSRERIKEILASAQNIAVVGLSNNPDRTSYMVSEAMQRKGYRIIPVNPQATMILGETCYPSLSAVAEPIDIVNVFRRADQVLPIAEEAVAVGAQVLWLQLDIINEEAAQVALRGGLEVIMDRCIKVEEAILQPKRHL